MVSKEVLFLFFGSLLVFFISNLLGGLSIGFGYTALHHQYKREKYPAFNYIFKIVTPIISAFLLYLIYYKLNENSIYRYAWLSVAGSWLIRMSYNILWGRSSLANWKLNLSQALLSSGIAFWINSKALVSIALLFPSRDNIVSQTWLIIILFTYKAMDDLHVGEKDSRKRKLAYLDLNYNQFKNKYNEIIQTNSNNLEVEILTYSILIHENFNRPPVARIFERIIGIIRTSGTYGVMQVRSEKPISDRDSVEMGIAQLNGLYEKITQITLERNPKSASYPWIKNYILKRTAWHFNNSDDYANDIYSIYRALDNAYYHVPLPRDPEERFNAMSFTPQEDLGI